MAVDGVNALLQMQLHWHLEFLSVNRCDLQKIGRRILTHKQLINLSKTSSELSHN